MTPADLYYDDMAPRLYSIGRIFQGAHSRYPSARRRQQQRFQKGVPKADDQSILDYHARPSSGSVIITAILQTGIRHR